MFWIFSLPRIGEIVQNFFGNLKEQKSTQINFKKCKAFEEIVIWIPDTEMLERDSVRFCLEETLWTNGTECNAHPRRSRVNHFRNLHAFDQLIRPPSIVRCNLRILCSATLEIEKQNFDSKIDWSSGWSKSLLNRELLMIKTVLSFKCAHVNNSGLADSG